LLDLIIFEFLQAVPEVATLPATEETSLIFAALETLEARVEEVIIPKVQGVAALASLSESEEEEVVEHIALVMSSFFSDFDDDEDDKEEDIATTALAVKDDVLLVAVEETPMSSKAKLMLPVTTPSAMIVAKERTGSTKPVMAEDKGKGPAKIEESKKAIEDDTPLGEGPFDQEL
jgi:hypothetical protein